MNKNRQRIVIVGAGINGLVAANYLQRGGCQVTLIERSGQVGGACISEVADIDGVRQPYALGASVLGLMQDFVFHETGLADRLRTFVPTHPKLVFFPGDGATRIYRNPQELDQELAEKWRERGAVEAFRADESRVVTFLQKGYRDAIPPSLSDAAEMLGQTLTDLWISGSARALLDHYFTSDRSKIYMAMTVTESGPVSLAEPYSAFTLPLMDSGSIFGGYYGFVEGGIWRVTRELGRLNSELGVVAQLSSPVHEVDTSRNIVRYQSGGQEQKVAYDQLVLATDPKTAARLVGSETEIQETESLRYRGSSGKLTIMFRNPVVWKHGSSAADSDAAFRFVFSVDSLDAFEWATLRVLDDDVAYEPGYMQIYCEGAAMRQLHFEEPFDRLTIFFKNLSLGERGEASPDIEQHVMSLVLSHIENPQDCVWSRLLTPRDLQQLFHFPGGNLDHTMLTGGQTFFDRKHCHDPAAGFYNFGKLRNVYLCGAGSYPCGSVAGTGGYMCSQQLLKALK